MTKTVSAVVAALLIVAPAVVIAQDNKEQTQPQMQQDTQNPSAQPQSNQPQSNQPMKGKEVRGKVKSWDSAKGVLTLEDGTALKLPTGSAKASNLSQGATIQALYEDKSGEKVITDIRVMQ